MHRIKARKQIMKTIISAFGNIQPKIYFDIREGEHSRIVYCVERISTNAYSQYELRNTNYANTILEYLENLVLLRL